MLKNSQKIKINIILTLVLILSITFVSAITTPQPTPIPTPTTSGATLDSVQNTVTQEGIKTRAEITAYADRKISEMINTVQTDGQKYIDDNFKVLDQRIQDIATKMVIKITIGIVIAIILGLSIWYAIYHRINKLLSKRPAELTRDEFQLTRAGLITPEYASKIEREQRTTYKMPPSPEFREAQPKPPSIAQIEAMIQLKRKEKEMEEVQKLKAEKINKFHAEAKKIMPKIQELEIKQSKKGGLINPEFGRKRREKKIEKLQEQLKPHREQVEKVIAIENVLDQKISELQSQSQEFSKMIIEDPNNNPEKQPFKAFNPPKNPKDNIPPTILEMPEYQTKKAYPEPPNYEINIPIPPIAPRMKPSPMPPEPEPFLPPELPEAFKQFYTKKPQKREGE